MKSPHEVLLLRFAPPNNPAGTPTLRESSQIQYRSDNVVAPTQHDRTTTHDRRHP
jgi:hypothetical protein